MSSHFNSLIAALSSHSSSYRSGQEVFVPPDIRYWASLKVNTTVYDNLGLPWYCYTNRQTHCIPIFKLPPNFRTTRRPQTNRKKKKGEEQANGLPGRNGNSFEFPANQNDVRDGGDLEKSGEMDDVADNAGNVREYDGWRETKIESWTCFYFS